MTDETHTHGTPDGREWDDDRLLAYALGLDDDPELAAAAAGDAALRSRLETVAADVNAIRDGLDAAVPSPGDTYADPAAPGWAVLREHLTAPPARPARRAWLNLRVLAPAAAVVLAVTAGITVIAQQTSQAPPAMLETSQSDVLAGKTEGTRSAGPAGDAEAGAQDADRTATRAALRLARRADAAGRFGLVLVARAQAASDSSQPFLVNRPVKGAATGVLRLDVADEAATEEGLYLLLLRPSRPAAVTRWVAAQSTRQTASPAAGQSPSPGATPFTAGAGPSPFVVLAYDGTVALALPLPAGTDPARVRLP